MADKTCPTCKNTFKYPSVLKTHLSSSSRCKLDDDKYEEFILNHKNPKKIIKCEICLKDFTRQSSKLRHQDNSQCGKLILEKTNLIQIQLTKEELDKIIDNRIQQQIQQQQQIQPTQQQINNDNNHHNTTNTNSNNNLIVNNNTIVQHIYPLGFERLRILS